MLLANFQRSWLDFPGHKISLLETSRVSWFHDHVPVALTPRRLNHNRSYGSELVEDFGPRVPEWSKPWGEMPLLKLSRQPTWKWQQKEVQFPDLNFSWFPVSYMFDYCIDIRWKKQYLVGFAFGIRRSIIVWCFLKVGHQCVPCQAGSKTDARTVALRAFEQDRSRGWLIRIGLVHSRLVT